MNVDKAFIQFAGMTAGRASSFFDFYAHDFEIMGNTLGSDVASTNLLAYTATMGNGLSATISVEDPVFRRTPIFSPTNNPTGATVNGVIQNFAQTSAPAEVFIGYTGGVPTRYSFVDAIQRSRMPDIVGALRLDQAWGSAQLSAAVHELNVGNVQNGAGTGTGSNISIPHTSNSYGWAVQGGLKINTPFIAPGDALYLQGATAPARRCTPACAPSVAATRRTRPPSRARSSRSTSSTRRSTRSRVRWSRRRASPPRSRTCITGRRSGARRSSGRTVRLITEPVPVWLRARGLRARQPGRCQLLRRERRRCAGHRFFQLSEALRRHLSVRGGRQHYLVAVKDLDIGVEGLYTQIGLKSGRVIDRDKSPTAYSNVAGINNGTFVPRTTTSDGVSTFRFRVQRDF